MSDLAAAYRWLDDQGAAFGSPGLEPRWTSSQKDAVSTAYAAASRVWFTVSHGILNEIYYPTIDRPQTRADWEGSTPAILVEAPLPFARASGRLAVRGTSNTFEATLHLTVTDHAGTVVADRVVMATSGSGTRGTFATTLDIGRAAAGTATLRAFEDSAQDGKPIHVVEIPVVVT